MCLYRVARGPTSADRIVAVDLLGVMIIGLCAVLTITTGRSWYLDIGLAWALQSFITILALSKFLEGKDLDS
jgi:multicomponent Na+:H+ antiporter subunit F